MRVAPTSSRRRFYYRPVAPEAPDRVAVQKAQRRAAMGISLRHSGHFFVVGSGGASPLFRRAVQAFIGATINRYTAIAIITKEISALRKAPYMILLLLMVTLRLEKSGLPPIA